KGRYRQLSAGHPPYGNRQTVGGLASFVNLVFCGIPPTAPHPGRLGTIPDVTITGEAHSCRCSHTSTNSSTLTSVKPTSIPYDGKIGPSSVLGVRATTLVRGAPITTTPA